MGNTEAQCELVLQTFDHCFSRTADSMDVEASLNAQKLQWKHLYHILGKRVFTREVLNQYRAIDTSSPFYPFAFSFLCSLVTVDVLPDEVVSGLHLHTVLGKQGINSSFDGGSSPDDWWLCDTAENYLFTAMKNREAVLIDDVFLMKARGKVAAICLENSMSEDGFVFLRGNWYSLADQNKRVRVRDAVARGKHRLHFPEATWIFMRELRESSLGLLPEMNWNRALKYRKELTEK